MKRIISISLSLLLLGSVLTACKPTGESPWEFEYKLEKGEFLQGDTIRITVEREGVRTVLRYFSIIRLQHLFSR